MQGSSRFLTVKSRETKHFLDYDPVEKIAFYYVTALAQDEWGYSVPVELESIERPFGLTIEILT